MPGSWESPSIFRSLAPVRRPRRVSTVPQGVSNEGFPNKRHPPGGLPGGWRVSMARTPFLLLLLPRHPRTPNSERPSVARGLCGVLPAPCPPAVASVHPPPPLPRVHPPTFPPPCPEHVPGGARVGSSRVGGASDASACALPIRSCILAARGSPDLGTCVWQLWRLVGVGPDAGGSGLMGRGSVPWDPHPNIWTPESRTAPAGGRASTYSPP